MNSSRSNDSSSRPLLRVPHSLNGAFGFPARMLKLACVLIIVAAACVAQSPEALRGSAGKDVRWNSGWFDFAQPANFFKGDQLRLSVGGAATKVVVRFLDDPRRADSPEGVVGVYSVGPDRSVRITLDSDYKGILNLCSWGT